MIITQSINLDVARRGEPPRVYAKQGDTGTRAVNVGLYNGGIAWTPPGGAKGYIRFKKPDGNGGLYDKLPDGTTLACEITGGSSNFIVNLAPEVLTCPGEVIADVAIAVGTALLGTATFVINVEASPAKGNTASNSYYNCQTLGEINAAIDALNTAMSQRVQTVNGKSPNSAGDVEVDVGVSTVNHGIGAVTLPINGIVTCETAADQQVKNVGAVGRFEPIPGAILAVRFTNGNTADKPRLSYSGAERPIVNRFTRMPISATDLTAGLYHLQYETNAWVLLDKIDTSAAELAVQIGNLEELDTTNKSSIVDALNEVLASGGGTTVNYYSVAYSGSGVVWSSAKPTVREGTALTTSFTLVDGYMLQSVKVMMGGADITSTAYTAGTNAISIPAVTADVTITVAATASTTLTDYAFKASGNPTFGAETTGGYQITYTGWSWSADVGNYFVVFFPSAGLPTGGHVRIDAGTNDVTGYQLACLALSAIGDIKTGSGSSAGYGFAKTPSTTLSGDTLLCNPTWGAAMYYATVPVGARYIEFDLPEGCYPCIWIRRRNAVSASGNNSAVVATNAAFSEWFAQNAMISVSTIAESDSPAVATAVDADFTQNYGVSVPALQTNAANEPNTFEAALESAKNAWMTEWGGSVDKIPIIVHTDQHGHYNKSMWDFIGEIVNWYNVSKVINLGDTANYYVYRDTDGGSDELDNYIKSTASVPFSKRIEVFGNHDTWADPDGDGTTNGQTPQAYLRPYFRNIFARGKDDYGNMVVHDDNYNIKYLILSGFAYDSALGGYSHYVIPSPSWDWIIKQLEANDGYDIVVLSHVALGRTDESITDPTGETAKPGCSAVDHTARTQLWTARKNKSSGSFVDQYGVSHEFDFTHCDSDLLCGLHGHEHADGYYYLGGVMLDAFFDAYYIAPNAIFFALIDRANKQLNVWKVDTSPQVQNYKISFIPTTGDDTV